MTFFTPAWALEAEHAIASYLNRRQRIISRLMSALSGRFVYDGR